MVTVYQYLYIVHDPTHLSCMQRENKNCSVVEYWSFDEELNFHILYDSQSVASRDQIKL